VTFRGCPNCTPVPSLFLLGVYAIWANPICLEDVSTARRHAIAHGAFVSGSGEMFCPRPKIGNWVATRSLGDTENRVLLITADNLLLLQIGIELLAVYLAPLLFGNCFDHFVMKAWAFVKDWTRNVLSRPWNRMSVAVKEDSLDSIRGIPAMRNSFPSVAPMTMMGTTAPLPYIFGGRAYGA